MCTLPPLVTCISFLGLECDLQQRLKAELFIERSAHSRCFHPAFQVELIGARNANIHEKATNTTKSMSGVDCHPIECCFTVSNGQKIVPSASIPISLGNSAFKEKEQRSTYRNEAASSSLRAACRPDSVLIRRTSDIRLQATMVPLILVYLQRKDLLSK